jgi:hypothetical protein
VAADRPPPACPQVARSPFDPTVFASCAADRTVRLWRRGVPHPLLSLGRQPGQRADCAAVCWSPADQLGLAAASGAGWELWDLGHSVARPGAVHSGTGSRLTAAAVAPGPAPRGPLLLCGGQDGSVSVHCLPPGGSAAAAHGTSLRQVLARHAAPAGAAAC